MVVDGDVQELRADALDAIPWAAGVLVLGPLDAHQALEHLHFSECQPKLPLLKW